MYKNAARTRQHRETHTAILFLNGHNSCKKEPNSILGCILNLHTHRSDHVPPTTFPCPNPKSARMRSVYLGRVVKAVYVGYNVEEVARLSFASSVFFYFLFSFCPTKITSLSCVTQAAGS